MQPDVSNLPSTPEFIGKGVMAGRSWFRRENDEVPEPQPGRDGQRVFPRGHPAGYEANSDVVDAVNTALVLDKPLLVTGRPGTGKTELAERIAYELDLGPVLRFEAQSLSEANDLFYRFDYISHMVAAKLVESGHASPEAADFMNFVNFGPLGSAILRSAPGEHERLRTYAQSLGNTATPSAKLAARSPMRAADEPLVATAGGQVVPAPPRRSVVLIDEIDKASRDFPNDLLNGIDRMTFTVRELRNFEVTGAGRDSGMRPIVIVTSNVERDLPHAFMRRCAFVHIDDPDAEQLAAIVRKRVFDDHAAPTSGNGLPPLYARLLTTFLQLRGNEALRYRVGTSELLDLSLAARQKGVTGHDEGAASVRYLIQSVSALAKHAEDRPRAAALLAGLAVKPVAT